MKRLVVAVIIALVVVFVLRGVAGGEQLAQITLPV
jgi:hypothetical protein